MPLCGITETLSDAESVRVVHPGKHNCIEHSAITENGKRVWKEYETLFVDGEDFEQIGEAFEQANTISKTMTVTKKHTSNEILTPKLGLSIIDDNVPHPGIIWSRATSRITSEAVKLKLLLKNSGMRTSA